MSTEPRPLQVVAISGDLSLLHEIAWVLEAVGYEVRTSSDLDQNALWRRYATADLVILDGRGIAEPASEMFALDSGKPIYRIFLYDGAQRTDFSAWYAAGAHDALRTPLSRGELLARLRTGARFLEFEKRVQKRSFRSAVNGMVSRSGFLHKLRRMVGNELFGSRQLTALAVSIDWFHGITHRTGSSASRNLVNSVARSILRVVGDGAVSAYLGDGRFVTLLVGQSASFAANAAETLAKDFAGRESRHESTPQATLTSAVIPWIEGSTADRFLNTVLESLHMAETSGGGRLVTHGEFSKEFAAWQEEMSTGNPFSNVVAQDIMEPFPAILNQDADQAALAAALARAGIAVRPYVDREGHMIGISGDAEAAGETRIGRGTGAAGEPLAVPETIAHNASFPEIYEAFSSRGCSTLVVTADDHPLGYLTCDGFLSMIDPITTETYAHTDTPIDELRFLAVPSLAGTTTAPEAAAISRILNLTASDTLVQSCGSRQKNSHLDALMVLVS